MAMISKIFIITILILSCVFLGIAITQVNAADDNPKFKFQEELRLRAHIAFDIKRYKRSIEQEQDALEGNFVKTYNALKTMHEKLIKQVATKENATNEEVKNRTESLKILADIEKRVSNFLAAMKAYKLSLEAFVRKNGALVYSYQDTVRQYESLATEYIRMQLEYRKLSEEHRAISDSFLDAQRESQNLTLSQEHYEQKNPDIAKFALTYGKFVEGMVQAAAEPPSGIVIINIGKNEGVIKGMRLSVIRGSEYIAKIRVTRVDPTTSFCVVESEYLQTRIRQGDSVRRSLILVPKKPLGKIDRNR
ncbi:MAG: hypothetical protein K8S87_09610 [Planctomycetes bacterium]|nr:hypothetical protein [Planctomycetota bacterium]